MNVTVLKAFLALAVTCSLLAGTVILYRRRRTPSFAFLLLGTVCFVVVALTHVFEALAILPAAGWGQPRSLGHYIDLVAAMLGITLVFAGLLFHSAHPRTG